MPIIKNKATLDSRPFTSGIDKMKAKVGGFGKSLKGVQMTMAKAFAAGAVVKFAKSSLDLSCSKSLSGLAPNHVCSSQALRFETFPRMLRKFFASKS